jgi:ATP-dependent Clp protease ATP-binding subunit ClpA
MWTRSGVNRFELARGLDDLLEKKGLEHPVVGDRQQGILVMAKTRQLYDEWDLATLLEPMLSAAELESKELGHNWIGSEHLVLSILRVSDPVLSSLLGQHGASYEQVKRSVVEILTR